MSSRSIEQDDDSSFMTYHRFCNQRWMPLVEQELLTLPKHRSSPLVFSGVRVTRSLVLCVCFVDRCLSFCTFSIGHCVVCPSIYGLWLPLWYLQTLLKNQHGDRIIGLMQVMLFITISFQLSPTRLESFYIYSIKASSFALEKIPHNQKKIAHTHTHTPHIKWK